MTQLIEFVVGGESDAVVTFEVDSEDVPDDLVLASGQTSSVAGRARVTLEQTLEQLQPSLERIAGVVRAMTPSEATIEFGLKMGGETGVIIAKGNAEANFRLSLVWK